MLRKSSLLVISLLLAGCASAQPGAMPDNTMVTVQNETLERQYVYSVCSGQPTLLGTLTGGTSGFYRIRPCISDLKFGFTTEIGRDAPARFTESVINPESRRVYVRINNVQAFVWDTDR